LSLDRVSCDRDIEFGAALPDDDNDDQSRRGPLMAMGAVALIFIIGLVLFRVLSSSARLQDCVLSGRTNCAPIERSNQ
jgi:hypothetical protein